MATKTKKKQKSLKKVIEATEEAHPEIKESKANYERSYRALQTMKRKDIQRECVSRGLDFQKVAGLSNPELIGWFQENFEAGQDETRLDLYDAWIVGELKKAGYEDGDPILSPVFRLGIAGDPKNWDEKELKKSLKPPKPWVESSAKGRMEGTGPDLQNIPKTAITGPVKAGTKKAYTFQLAQSKEGADFTYTKETIIDMVIKAFPEAAESSIKAWTSKARKLIQSS